MIQVLVETLKSQDVFDCLFGSRGVIPCQVQKTPKIEADRVTLVVSPLSKKSGDRQKLSFRRETKVWVYEGQDLNLEKRSLYRSAIADFFGKHNGFYCIKEIADLIAIADAKTSIVQEICSSLAQEKTLVRRSIKSLVSYRRPVAVGDFIIELQGSKSERWGRVYEFRALSGSTVTAPLVFWIRGIGRGTCTLSHEDRLTPVCGDPVRKELQEMYERMISARAIA